MGMRSYRAVWWQNGMEHYPPFTDVARDTVAPYLGGGGRMAVTGHDVARAHHDAAPSPYYTAARGVWLPNTLRTNWLADPSNRNGLTGEAAYPISGGRPNHQAPSP